MSKRRTSLTVGIALAVAGAGAGAGPAHAGGEDLGDDSFDVPAPTPEEGAGTPGDETTASPDEQRRLVESEGQGPDEPAPEPDPEADAVTPPPPPTPPAAAPAPPPPVAPAPPAPPTPPPAPTPSAAPAPVALAPATVAPAPPPPTPSPASVAPPVPATPALTAVTSIREGRSAAPPSRTLPRRAVEPAAVTRAEPRRTVAAAEQTLPGGRDRHTVAAGESLWSIARAALGGDASSADIALLVDRLWRLNARQIGTGNRDLLLAGTVLRMS